ncbi:hypothetical protein FB451DRAFT_109275 [Mycena latifolia]|nr:hypothetical protein FB451DRAFT_109275 [Mycena latifolia]
MNRLNPSPDANISPIRHLPSEILVEIFALCWRAFTPTFDDIDNAISSLETEMCRLAHLPLLLLSRVCSRWHGIVMNTPSLWTTIEIDGVLWGTPTSSDRALSLLTAVLGRSGRCGLTVAVSIDEVAPHGAILKLLAAHSERWQTATFICGASDLQHFSSVKGRLPRLETLRLWGSPSPLDAFVHVPRLRELEFGGTPDALTTLGMLPLEQLRTFHCGEFVGLGELMGLDVSPSMTLMPRLSNRAEFKFELRLFEGADIDAFNGSVSVPSVTSHISALSIDVADGFSLSNIGLTMAKIIDAMTLPTLTDFGMDSQEYPILPLPWPHNHFLALSARSSFPTHLRGLQLYHTIITEAELLECLYALPGLERLAISDHQTTTNGGVDQLLITDFLFAKLTAAPDNLTPVPRLRFFGCLSLLQFDAHQYLKFLESRIAVSPFESHVYWLPGRRRDLDLGVAARLEELRAGGDLVYSFVEADV